MMKMLKNTVVAGIVALGALASAPPAAQAEGIYFQFGVSEGYGYYHDRDWRRHNRRCTPGRALDKAERLGFRRVAVHKVTDRRIVVSGRRHGEWYDVVFSRRGRNCPVIRIR